MYVPVNGQDACRVPTSVAAAKGQLDYRGCLKTKQSLALCPLPRSTRDTVYVETRPIPCMGHALILYDLKAGEGRAQVLE